MIETYTHPRTRRTVRTRKGVHRVEAAVACYEAGGTVETAAEAAGMSGTAVHRWLVALGVVRDNEWAQRLRFGTEDLPEEAARLYLRGLSINDIAALKGVSHSNVIHALDRAGVERRSKSEGNRMSRRSRAARKRAVEACRLRAAGLSYAEVGRRVGVTGTMARHYWEGPYNPYTPD